MKDEIKDVLQMLEAMASNDDIAFLPRQASLLLDYITNLQEENEKNKEYSEFYKDMSDKWKDMSDVFKKNYEDYKSKYEELEKFIIERAYLDDDNTYLDKIKELKGE